MVSSYLYTPATLAGGIKLARFVFISSPLFFAPFLLLNEERDLKQFVAISLVLSLVLAFRIGMGNRPRFRTANDSCGEW